MLEKELAYLETLTLLLLEVEISPLTANSSGTATGNFSAIDLNDLSITSGSGAINLTGIGGDTGSNNYGIVARNGALIESTTGNISM